MNGRDASVWVTSCQNISTVSSFEITFKYMNVDSLHVYMIEVAFQCVN